MIYHSLYIGKSKERGRGIFTNEEIAGDTIIEISPVIVMDYNDRKLLDQTLLHDYIFEWQPNGKNMCCMALGNIPLYNHSYESNCEYFMNYDERTMFIKTVRYIAEGEELTINYNGDWNDKKAVWFDAKES
ncbi:MAG TPA: SET domain-containing protein-lysine N-methyltransferase [Flavipsychrobacter sp.]|nr:SET domain-containing protein-lysine N-methyltransferase [Flavipsychrobacter sp.]